MSSPEQGDMQARMSNLVPEGSPQSAYTIEALRYEDIDAYRDLMVSVMRTSPTSNPQRLEEQVRTRTREYYEEIFTNPLEHEGMTLLTSRDPNGALAGVLEAKVSTDRHGLTTGFVSWVCTEPRHQKQGVARGLYDRYAEIVRGQNIPYMKAFIDNTNTASLRFHQRYGFDIASPYGSKADNTGKWYIKAISNAKLGN